MIFKLTDEQIEEIIELYGGSKKIISKIEFKLNFYDIIDDEDDYVEIVKLVVSQHQSIKEQLSHIEGKRSRIECFMNIDEIIDNVLNRQFINMDHKQEQLQKARMK